MNKTDKFLYYTYKALSFSLLTLGAITSFLGDELSAAVTITMAILAHLWAVELKDK